MRKLKTLTSLTNHWQKAGAIHSLAWIPQSIQMIFLWFLDGWLIWREHPCSITKQSLMIASHRAVIRFLFPFLLRCVVSSTLAEIYTIWLPQQLLLTCLWPWLLCLRPCWVLRSPTKSQIGRLEIGFSPWLGYFLAVWPCTSYFTSLGFGFLHYKMKEPN